MGYNAAIGMAQHTDLRSAVSWHLTSNCYPPLPTDLIDVAVDAIYIAAAGAYDDELSLPEGILYKDRDWLTVAELIDGACLYAFVDVVGDEG